MSHATLEIVLIIGAAEIVAVLGAIVWMLLE